MFSMSEAMLHARKIIPYPMTVYKIVFLPDANFSGSPPEKSILNAPNTTIITATGAPSSIIQSIIFLRRSDIEVVPRGLGSSTDLMTAGGFCPEILAEGGFCPEILVVGGFVPES